MAGLTRKVGAQVGKQLAPRITELAPGFSSSFVREALHRAIDGVGPYAPVARVADRHLAAAGGNLRKAVRSVVDLHVRLAGASGLVTSFGGLVTTPVTVPANLAGIALLQFRMVAAIAHLHGYDLDDPRVHNAVLLTTLGEDTINLLLKGKRIPAPPMAIATAPVHDATLDAVVSAEVARGLVARVAGRRMATAASRRIPGLGGLVGMGADGWATYTVGTYAERELLPRRR